MYEYRHTAGAQPCFRVACYAPSALFQGGTVALVQADAHGWPTATTLESVRCGACGVRLTAADVTAQPTTVPIITCAERRQPDAAAKHVRLTAALLASDVDRGCLTARQIADYLQVDPRVIIAAMESGAIAPAFRVGRRGGVGEWRCAWAAGRAYIQSLERQTEPAA